MTESENRLLQEEMSALGVSKTVYAIPYPEVWEVLETVFCEPNLKKLYEKPYTQVQDPMGRSFFQKYAAWSRDITDIDLQRFRHWYPGNGSSEVIRETIASHAITGRRRREGDPPAIHVFSGEYEGYEIYAKEYGLTVFTHPRNHYADSITQHAQPGDLMFISQPSAIDGNVWGGYDDYMQWMQTQLSSIDVMLDASYVGAVSALEYHVKTTYDNIRSIFVSLSKPFGVFYHRIGGMLSREPYPTLYGNRLWFKNLLALRCGEALLNTFDPHILPQKYKNVQDDVVQKIRALFGQNVQSSDVVLLAHQTESDVHYPLQRHLLRGNDSVRYCLTPSMDAMINPPA